MKIVKTDSGYQIQNDSGQIVPATSASGGDQRTLASLYGGGSGNAAGSTQPAGPSSAPAPAPSSVPATTVGTPPPASGGATGDPLTMMNSAIGQMLADAKTGKAALDVNAQKGNAAINTAAATADMSSTTPTGQNVAGLSPTQQNQIRGAESGVYDTAGKNFNDQISYFGKQISDIESSLGAFGDLASVQLQATLSPQAIQGVLQAFAAGDTSALSSLPASTRAQVFAEMAKNPQILEQYKANAKKGVLGATAQVPVYDGNNNIIGYTDQAAAPSPFTQSLDLAKLANQTPAGTTYNIYGTSPGVDPSVTGHKTTKGGSGLGKPLTLAQSQQYNINDPSVTQEDLVKVQSIIQSNRSGGWPAAANAVQAAGFDPTTFDSLFWQAFHAGGLKAYNETYKNVPVPASQVGGSLVQPN